jgi:hypothetical protein
MAKNEVVEEFRRLAGLNEQSLSREEIEGVLFGDVQDLIKIANSFQHSTGKIGKTAVNLPHLAKRVSDFVSLFSSLKEAREFALSAIKRLKATSPVNEKMVVEDRTVPSELEEQLVQATGLLQMLPATLAKARYKRAREMVAEIEAELEKFLAVIDREEKAARGPG